MPDEKEKALEVVAQAAAEALKVVANAAGNAKEVIALESEIALSKKLKEERDVSNTSYAPIIVKTIVFGFIALICIAFVAWLTGLIWPK